MKAGEIIEAVERFFLDIIGTVVPGVLLLLGWRRLFGTPPVSFDLGLPGGELWWLLGLAYVVGHFVTGVGTFLTKPGWLTMHARRYKLTKVLVRPLQSDKEVCEAIADRAVYKAFVARATDVMPWLASIPPSELHEWRSVAMSLATPQENHTVYRFMFISLLNLGAGTVCILLAFAWVAALIATWFHGLQPWGSVAFPQRQPFDFSVLIVGLVLCYFLLERRDAFYCRALRVPFTMGIVKLPTAQTRLLAKGQNPVPAVYLAGGSRSNWQDNVISALVGWNIIDPRTHHLSEERAYTAWDLDGIRRCDWLLANFEATNPGGYNLALEIGYAKALGKRIVLIDAKGASDPGVRRYTGMLHVCADADVESLDEAIAFLQKLRPVA
jgi:hypothetical protein